MAAGVAEVASQTAFAISSSQRLANRARTQRVDSTSSVEKLGGSGTLTDSRGALEKEIFQVKCLGVKEGLHACTLAEY